MADKIDRAKVEHIARLARLDLSPEEIAGYQHDLSCILDHFDLLSELDTDSVEPCAHPLPVHNVLRQDEPGLSYDPDRALQNAPKRDGSFFVVPKVLEKGGSD